MTMKMLLKAMTVAFITMLWTANSWATLTEQLQNDFSPVDGYVVMAAGNEYIIDLDSSQGVASGDLFTMVKPGEKIVHPVTGEVIGTLDTVSAVLQVTRIKTGYSYAQQVRGDMTPEAGSAIRRFDGVDAVFVGGDQSADLLSQVKTALTGLQWQGTSQVDQADLYFSSNGQTVQVRDAKGQLLRSYAVTGAAPVAVVAPVAAPAVMPTPAVVAPAAVATSGAVQYQSQSQVRSFGAGGLSMEFPRFNKLGQFGATTRTSDFEAVAGRLLLATSDAGTVKVFDVSGDFKQVAAGDSATLGQILSVSWWQPAAGELYLVTNVWADEQVQSDLLRWNGNGFDTVQKGIGKLFAAFDIDSDGQSETLLGQEFNRETFYGQRVRQAQLSGDRLDYSAPTITVPRNFRVLGALIADVTGNGEAEVVFLRNRRLYVYSGTDQLYKSNKEMGASISGVTYDIDPLAQNPMIATAVCEVAPVAADLDGDGVREILAIGAEGSMLQNAGVTSAVNQSWLAVFKYQDGMMLKGTLGDKLERPLQGVAVSGDQALMVATDVAGLMDGQAASYLLAVPLN